MWLTTRWLGEERILRRRAGTKGWERVTAVNSERRKAGEERWEGGKGKKLIGKHGVKRERRKMVWGVGGKRNTQRVL